MSNIFDYFGSNKSVTDPDYDFDRSLGGQTLQDTLNWLYGAARGPAQNLASLVPEVLATSAGMASPWHTGAQAQDWWREKGLQPFQPQNEAQQEAMSFLGAAPAVVEKGMRKVGEGMESLTGSPTAGALTYVSPMFFPYGWGTRALTGRHGPWGLNPATRSVAENMNIFVKDFYSPKKGAKEKGLVETGLSAGGHALSQQANPFAAKRMRNYGISTGDFAQIESSIRTLERGGSKKAIAKAHQHLASQIRKAWLFANKYNPEGEPAKTTSPLGRAAAPFIERTDLAEGLPSVDQVNYTIGQNVNPQILQVLTDEMSRATGLKPGDTTLLASWSNPGKWLGAPLSGEVGALKSGAHAMDGYIAKLHSEGLPINAENINLLLKEDYARKMRNNGFIKKDYNNKIIPIPKISTGKRGPKKNDYLAYADIDGTWRWDERGERATGENVRYVPAVPHKVKDIEIDGNHYLSYNVKVLTYDELLAYIRGDVLFDLNTGRSKILMSDELDIFGDNIRGFFENPAQRRILTLDYIDRVPSDKIAKYYPEGQTAREKKRKHDDPTEAIVESLAEVKAGTKLSPQELAKHYFPFIRGPVGHAAIVEARNEDRKARNIY